MVRIIRTAEAILFHVQQRTRVASEHLPTKIFRKLQ